MKIHTKLFVKLSDIMRYVASITLPFDEKLRGNFPKLCKIVNLPNTLGPEMLVQPGFDPHIIGTHLLLGKLLDLLDSTRSTVLEADAV